MIRLTVGIIATAALLLALLASGDLEGLWRLFSDREKIQEFVEAAGPLAPAVYIVLLVAQAVAAPLPAPALAIAGGYSFGTFEGFALTWMGALLGGMISFGFSRLFGRRFVARSARLEEIDRHLQIHGPMLVFILRLIPLVSFDLISYAAGLSSMPFRKFVLATALGMAPGTFVFVYLGGGRMNMGIWIALTGLAALSVTAYVYLRLRHRTYPKK